MPEDPPESEPLPWKGADLFTALLFLMPAADFAAIYGNRAATLRIPGAEMAQQAPLLMIGSFIFIPMILAMGRLAPWRQEISKVVAMLWIGFPPALLALGSVSIPLSREMSDEEMTTFRQSLSIPTVHTSSGNEHWLQIRRSDDSAPVRACLASMGVIINAGPPGP